MSITTAGVIGAGTMGHGIAQTCAVKGINVVLVDISDEVLKKAVASIDGSLERLVKKEKMTDADKKAAMARIKTSTSYDDFKAAQIVIEAATENEAIKIKILKQVDSVVGANAIIASNTSSISITQLAATVSHPDKLIGMHFFNPVPVMGLVEVIRGLQTSDATCNTVKTLAEQLGKTPVMVKNAAGFVVNRLLVPMINEAFFVLGEGLASAQDIDEAMKLGCNHPIGPLALADMVGLDVCLAIMDVLYNDFGDPKYRASPLLREYVAAGRLGRKTKAGVYTYDK